jgi:hypothetical protein
MTLDEAKRILNECVRSELRDHAFGDAEVYWEDDGEEVAFGYFGQTSSVGGDGWSFEGREADELRKCGRTGLIERNDETGPSMYQEGKCMPSLTLEGVREELTGTLEVRQMGQERIGVDPVVDAVHKALTATIGEHYLKDKK